MTGVDDAVADAVAAAVLASDFSAMNWNRQLEPTSAGGEHEDSTGAFDAGREECLVEDQHLLVYGTRQSKVAVATPATPPMSSRRFVRRVTPPSSRQGHPTEPGQMGQRTVASKTALRRLAREEALNQLLAISLTGMETVETETEAEETEAEPPNDVRKHSAAAPRESQEGAPQPVMLCRSVIISTVEGVSALHTANAPERQHEAQPSLLSV